MPCTYKPTRSSAPTHHACVSAYTHQYLNTKPHTPTHTYTQILHTHTQVGVIGLGGLGHIAVKFLVNFGVNVTVFDPSPEKEAQAKTELGVTKFVNSSDQSKLAFMWNSLDFIIDTMPKEASKPIDPYISVLKVGGVYVMVGSSAEYLNAHTLLLLVKNKTIAGSFLGGIQETQETLDLCARKNITCMVEKMPLDQVNVAWERMCKADVRYRFVLDVGSYTG